MVHKFVRCPQCGYSGVIECIQALGTVSEQCTCPKCGHRISDMREP